jgi:hypothetical protein
LFILPEYCFEFVFERSRRNSKRAKPRQAFGGRGVDLHKFDLIAGGCGRISARPATAFQKAKGIRINTGRKPALRAMVRNSSSYE